MSILQSFGKIRKNLTNIGNKEPLNFISILLIIALDVFVIVNLFSGLDVQVRQLTSPGEKVPWSCLSYLDNTTLLPDQVMSIVEYGHDHDYDELNNKKIISSCKEIYKAVDSIRDSIDVKTVSKQIYMVRVDIRKLEQDIQQKENSYDTLLLEAIAKQKTENSITTSTADSVKIEIYNHNKEKNILKQEQDQLENKLMSLGDTKKFFSIIKTNKPIIKNIYEKEKFWYPIKKYGVKFLFLFPLFLIFWFLYKVRSKREKNISSLIFAHLLIVTAIPIIFGIFEILLDLIPDHLLKDFFQFLESWNIAVVFNYILIILAILATLGLVYFVQKKLFSKKRTYLKRISKKRCPYCATGLRGNEKSCYKCGERLMVICTKCAQTTHSEGTFCRFCGDKDFKLKNDSF